MKAEHLKECVQGAIRKEKAEADNADGYTGAGDTWQLLVNLIQHIWDTGDIPRQMLWVIVVLIPKENSGNYCSVGLFELLWKLIEKIMDAWLAELKTLLTIRWLL